MGFPSSAIRRVALINGSQNGLLQSQGSPCGTAFELEIKKTVLTRILLLWWFNSSVTSKLVTTKVAFAPNANNVCKVFEGASLFPFGIGIPGHNRYAKAINGGASIDLAPGGTFDTQAIIKAEGGDIGYRALIKVNFSNLIKNHSFIPTKSALAFKWDSQANIGDWGENLSGRNLVCTNETPFDAYYAPTQNEEHVLLSAGGASFVSNEIEGNPTINSARYGGIIQGPPNLCNTATYQLSGLPPGVQVSWQASPSNLFTVSSGAGAIANLQKLNSTSSGHAIITFNISGKCGIQSVTKNIWLGSNSTMISNPYDPSCYCYIYGPVTGKTYKFFAETSNQSTNSMDYKWTIIPDTGSPEDYPMIFYGKSINFEAYMPGTYTFKLQQYIEGCGWSIESTRTFYFNQSYDYGLMVYPNPADDEVSVSLSEELTSKSFFGAEYEIALVNSQQVQVFKTKTNQNTIIIPVKKLKEGVYYLKLVSKDIVVLRRIMIARGKASF